MNNENHRPMPDILDQATEALRGTLSNVSAPAGPTVELAADTVKALQDSSVARQGLPYGKKRRVFRITRYSGLAAAVAFLAIIAGWRSMTQRGAALAFADVVENVKRAQSVTFVSTMMGPQSRSMRQRFYIQGDAYRMELPSAQEGFEPPADAPPVLIAVVANAKRKEAIQIDFSRKTVRKIQAADKAWQAMAQGLANPVDKLRSLTDNDAERIADEVLAGHQTQVYRLKKHDIFKDVRVGKGDTAKLWVDPESGLPIRLAVERALDGGEAQIIFSLDDFTWNDALDPELFSLQVPPDYSVEDGPERDSPGGDEGPTPTAELRSLEKRIREAAAMVTPTIVAIALAPGQPSAFRHHLPSASGVILTADGLILSQYHVTHLANPADYENSRQPGERVNVILHDGRECEAELLGADRAYDLSLLRLIKPGPYPHASVDENVTVNLGDRLLYVGHPQGYRAGRAPVVRLGTALSWHDDTFVSDFQVTGGDSGGAAFDLDGHLLGIVRNSGVPQILRGSFRRGQFLFAGSTISLIHSRLDSMRRGELAAIDDTAMRKAREAAETAKILPTQRWTQGSETTSAYRDVVKLAQESVVAIQDGAEGELSALGTVVDSDGYILTKASELPAEPMCRLPDGRAVAATVVGVDPAFDLALLKAPVTDLRAIEWSADAAPAPGTLLAAPGQGEAPLAIGIVSAPRRDLAGPYPEKMAPRNPVPAALPEVIGSAVQGRGYWIEYAEGKAAAAGLEPGDVLLTIGGRAVRHHQDLAACVKGRWAGERVPVSLLRAGKKLTLPLQMRAEGQSLLSRRNDDFPTVFEHDVALTADECGGPVVGLDGKVLGVTIARVGLHGCMAIPADCLQRLLPELKSGKLAANWITPARLAQTAPSDQPGVKTGKPVTMTVGELKQALATRADKFKSLLVEYDLITEALVEPRLLMSWNLHHVRDWQEHHRIAFSGEKRFTQIERAEVMPLYAPPDRVIADPNAPRSVAVNVERERQNAISKKEKGNSNYLFATTRAEKLASMFDGRKCFLWSEQGNRMVPAHDASAYNSPLMYLAGLGLRPIDPVSSANAERRKWQRQFWFPENFAVYETCRILPTEEYVDDAACIVLAGEFHVEADNQQRLFTEKIYFDPALGFTPRRWESQVDGVFAGLRTNSQFEEFAPGCWLPWESCWTRGAPAWAAPELRNRPAYTYNLRLRKARVNDVRDDLFVP